MFEKYTSVLYLKSCNSGLPWWLGGKESTCQCGRHGFSPWSGTIPLVTEQLGPCTATIEPMFCYKRSHHSEKPEHLHWRAAPTHHNQRKAQAAVKGQHNQKHLKKSIKSYSKKHGVNIWNQELQMQHLATSKGSTRIRDNKRFPFSANGRNVGQKPGKQERLKDRRRKRSQEEVWEGDFPGGPVAKTPHSQCREPRFELWSGTQIPHATTKRFHMLQLRPGAAKYINKLYIQTLIYKRRSQKNEVVSTGHSFKKVRYKKPEGESVIIQL